MVVLEFECTSINTNIQTVFLPPITAKIEKTKMTMQDFSPSNKNTAGKDQPANAKTKTARDLKAFADGWFDAASTGVVTLSVLKENWRTIPRSNDVLLATITPIVDLSNSTIRGLNMVEAAWNKYLGVEAYDKVGDGIQVATNCKEDALAFLKANWVGPLGDLHGASNGMVAH